MNEKILITSALPYANGPLHFGHIAGAYLPADCYARFQRLMRRDVLYICGSDEYGVAITLSADLAGRSPQEHVDIFHEINRNFFERLRISFDHYSRTTWEGHPETVHQYFNDLLANGYIEERVTDQLYSEKDQRFLADRYVVGTCPRCGFGNARGDECPGCGASYDAVDLKDPRSKLTDSPLVRRPTKHWFLLLEKFKDRLNLWLEDKKWKPNVLNFIKGYINELHARAITRDSTWGVSVPLSGSDGKILYVWFDAPIGYISATKDWAQKIGAPDRWKEYWMDEKTKLVNFIGKDNIPFHASIFPAMTMGQNLPYKLVDELPANEFYKLEGRQFSKSEGWYIDLEDFFSRYSTDQIRYAIASNAPETSDSEFIWKDFQVRCNSDLLGKYGNLANRVFVFIANQCQGKIPEQGTLEPIDEQFLATIKGLVDQAEESYASFRVRRASHVVMELAQLGNIYFDSKKPWRDAKDEGTKARMWTTLYCCMECLKALALISCPIIPDAANQLWNMMGYTSDLNYADWVQVRNQQPSIGQVLPTPTILFQKVEDEMIEREIEKLHHMSKSKEKTVQVGAIDSVAVELSVVTTTTHPDLKPLVDIEDFRKLDFRVGVILKAEAVPKSKKLIQLEVDLGIDQRKIVAGIGGTYDPAVLVGRKVVVVANLKPATLMGVKSDGMLLAGKDGVSLELISIDSISVGSIVS
jgi:methionyl-tRNA synthetase